MHKATIFDIFFSFSFLKPEVSNYISAACNRGFSVHPEDISVQYTKHLLCLVLDAFILN